MQGSAKVIKNLLIPKDRFFPVFRIGTPGFSEFPAEIFIFRTPDSTITVVSLSVGYKIYIVK